MYYLARIYTIGWYLTLQYWYEKVFPFPISLTIILKKLEENYDSDGQIVVQCNV